jgi:hypothetical protein
MRSQKQYSLKTSTDAGRMISTNPIVANVHTSIRDNLDPDSNLTEESYLHSEKQPSPKTISIALSPRTNCLSVSIPRIHYFSVLLPRTSYLSISIPRTNYLSVSLSRMNCLSVSIPRTHYFSLLLPRTSYLSISIPRTNHLSVSIPRINDLSISYSSSY